MNKDFMDHAISDDTLPMTDKYVYLVMAGKCDWRDNVPYSGRQLAKWAGMDYHSWRRACDRLHAANWIRPGRTPAVQWNLRCSCTLCKYAEFPVHNEEEPVDKGGARTLSEGQISLNLNGVQFAKAMLYKNLPTSTVRKPIYGRSVADSGELGMGTTEPPPAPSEPAALPPSPSPEDPHASDST